MCRELLHSGTCSNSSCAYAHSREELRADELRCAKGIRARRVRAGQARRASAVGVHVGSDAKVTGPEVASKHGDQTGNSDATAWRVAEAVYNVGFPASKTVPLPSVAFLDRPLTSDWSALTSTVSVEGMPYLSQDVSSLEPLSLKVKGDPAYVSLQPTFISRPLMESTGFLTGLGSPASTPSDVSSNHAPGAQSQDISGNEGSEDGRPGDVDWEEMCVGLSLMAHVAV